MASEAEDHEGLGPDNQDVLAEVVDDLLEVLKASTLMRTSASGSPVNISITELLTMENLFVFQEGYAWRDVLDGIYDADGRVPCQMDDGLKCFGHSTARAVCA